MIKNSRLNKGNPKVHVSKQKILRLDNVNELLDMSKKQPSTDIR